jgi:hypothetical protein
MLFPSVDIATRRLRTEVSRSVQMIFAVERASGSEVQAARLLQIGQRAGLARRPGLGAVLAALAKPDSIHQRHDFDRGSQRAAV